MKYLLTSIPFLLIIIFSCNKADGLISSSGQLDEPQRSSLSLMNAHSSSFAWTGYTDTKGGTDGEVVRVTNLNNSGPGSFRHAVSEVDGPRLVVFDVGGVIDLEWQPVRITNSNITIAGQTAPSPGITLIKGDIRIGTNDVIIEHIFVRPGYLDEDNSFDAITTVNRHAYDIIIRNCSLSWGTDETLTASGPVNPETSRRITFKNNIISEALHPNSGRAMLIHHYVRDILVAGNLFAHNSRRNPTMVSNTEVVIVNNVLYNINVDPIRFTGVESLEESPKASVVGNILFHGPNTWPVRPLIKVDENGSAYLEDNKVIKMDGSEGDIHLPDFSDPLTVLDEKPAWVDGLTPMPVEDVAEYVYKNTGARPWDRDPIDQRILDDVQNRTGKLISHQDDVGGYPDYTPTTRTLDVPDMNRQDWLYSLTTECGGSKDCI